MFESNKIIIIGAGGHGRVVADIARLNGYSEIYFLDDADIDKSGNYDVIGKVGEYKKYISGFVFTVAIGNWRIRKEIYEKLISDSAEFVTLIHPMTSIGEDVVIEEGTVVMAGAVVNSGAKIGKCSIVNTCSSVDHDCNVGDYCHVSIGARLAGTVSVGNCTMIGAGAVVINNIRICDETIVGAGSVVVKDITDKGTYVGVPARMIK